MLHSRSRVYSNEVSQLFWRLTSGLATSADESLRYSRKNLAAIGAVGCVTFPVYYVIWWYMFPQDYESLALRVIGSVACLPLMLVRLWPHSLERWLPTYFWLAAT